MLSTVKTTYRGGGDDSIQGMYLLLVLSLLASQYWLAVILGVFYSNQCCHFSFFLWNINISLERTCESSKDRYKLEAVLLMA